MRINTGCPAHRRVFVALLLPLTVTFWAFLAGGVLAASIELTVTTDAGPVPEGAAEGTLFLESKNDYVDDTETDASGKLKFSGLAAGTYMVRVRHVESIPAVTKFRHHIALGAGETATGTVAFRSGGGLNIRVRSTTGSVPTGDIHVYLHNQITTEFVKKLSCDDVGEADFGLVTPGIYFVRLWHWSMPLNGGFYTFDIVVQPGSALTRRVELPLCTGLKFTVSDSFGTAPSGAATVSLWRQTSPGADLIDTVSCDSAGRVDFGQVVAGTYRARVDYNRGAASLQRYYFGVEAEVGQTQSFPILLDEVSRLRCSVKDAAGAAITSSSVRLSLIHDASFEALAEDRTPSASGLVDFGYVPAGSVSIKVENSLIDPPKTWYLVGETAPAGETRTVNITVERGCDLSLKVKYDGASVPEGSATAYLLDQSTGELVANASADAAGACKFNDAAPGTYIAQVLFVPDGEAPIERFFFDISAPDLGTESRTLTLLDYERGDNTCTFTANLRDAVSVCNGFVSIYDQQTGALVEETSRYGVGEDGTQAWQVPAGTYTVKHVYDESSPHYCAVTSGIVLSAGENYQDNVTFPNCTLWVDLMDRDGSAECLLWIYDGAGMLLTDDEGMVLLVESNHTLNLLPGTFCLRYQYADPNSIPAYPLDQSIHLSAGERKTRSKTVGQGQLTLSAFDSSGPVSCILNLYTYVPESQGYRSFQSLILSDSTEFEGADGPEALELGEKSYVLYVGQYLARLTYYGFDGNAHVETLAEPVTVGSGQSVEREIVVQTSRVNASIQDSSGASNGEAVVFDEATGRWVGGSPASGVGNDGYYSLTVPPGEYRVLFSYGSDAPQSRTEHLVKVSAGGSADVDASFVSNEAEVTVRQNGAALPQARAFLQADDGFYIGMKNQNGLGSTGKVSFWPETGSYYFMVEDYSAGEDNKTTVFSNTFTASIGELIQITLDTGTQQKSVRKSGGSATVEIAYALSYPSLLDAEEATKDGGENVLFCVCVAHRDGRDHIASVEANLSPIGEAADTALCDDGTNGDLRAGDFIYSRYLPVSYSGQGIVELSVYARDTEGNIADDIIELVFRGSGSDNVPPGRVIDLYAHRDDDDPTQCNLSWTASGDDGYSGQAHSYELRYGAQPFDASSFGEATLYEASTSWTPETAGVKEQRVVSGLGPEASYYFALKVFDDANNASPMSNLASTEAAPDETPPAAIGDLLAVSGPSQGEITLTWTAPGDDGTVGTIVGYVLKYGQSFINAGNWDSTQTFAPSLQWQPHTSGADESKVLTGFDPSAVFYFAIKSVDDADNWSAISNCASAGGGKDSIPPARIEDLEAHDASVEGQLILSWTATGDDGDVGTATRYILKYSEFEITSANWAFAQTFQRSLSWAPLEAGELELKTVDGLAPGRAYHLALKAFDEGSNESEISNNAQGTAGSDAEPPSSIRDLAATAGENSATLTWTATGDNGIEGTASSYELRYSYSEINQSNWEAATIYEPSHSWIPLPYGSSESYQVTGLVGNLKHFFAIVAFDEADNASGVSNPASATPTGETTPPAAVTDLSARRWLHEGEIRIRFTATGDNGKFGTASGYELRLLNVPINETNWATATVYPDSLSWVPRKSGSTEEFVLSGLTVGSYYYMALKVVDDSFNWSPVSNCTGTPPSDGSPTSAILLNASSFTAGDRFVAEFRCYNPGEALDVDLYGVVALPDGQLLTLPDLQPIIAPVISWRPLPGYFCPDPVTFLDFVLDGSIPVGTYTFYTVFTQPGTLTPVTDVWATPFEIR